MRIGKLKIALLGLCCVAVAFELWHFRRAPTPSQQLTSSVAQKNKPDFALLPASETAYSAGYFGYPKAHVEGWEPTVADIDEIEADLPQISALSNKDSDPRRHIDNPGLYFRQYLAAVIDGRKTILLNAFCANQEYRDQWRKHLVFALDGGKCYWHATFDTGTKTFSNLIVNGVG